EQVVHTVDHRRGRFAHCEDRYLDPWRDRTHGRFVRLFAEMTLVGSRSRIYSDAQPDFNQTEVPMPTPIELLLDPISLVIIVLYAAMIVWEAIAPARPLPVVRG